MRDIEFLRAVKTLSWREFVLYPKATLIDYYKLFYQGTFGPGHIIENREIAYKALVQEIKGSSQSELPFVQDISFLNPYCRVSLEVLEKKMIGEETFMDMLMESCKVLRPITAIEWNEAWQEIEEILFQILPKLYDKKLVKMLHDEMYGDKIPLFRHSELFRETYKPHYRLIRKDLLPTHIR
ncbi:MAG TPA: hypothetical protein PLE74_11995 [Candidatus Cloacimonadota bacterium]|nr:hypothetical protein [Candidatus Cloacimonadota bacterium]HPT72987.1 hypothetical protein [Candidatus Cloacimonadota bacterium]